MARYVTLLKFTSQGARALKRSPARAAAFRKAAERVGVKVEALLWTVGAYDGLLLLNARDEKAALRCLTQLASAGFVRTESLQAFDAEEFQAIVGK